MHWKIISWPQAICHELGGTAQLYLEVYWSLNINDLISIWQCINYVWILSYRDLSLCSRWNTVDCTISGNGGYRPGLLVVWLAATIDFGLLRSLLRPTCGCVDYTNDTRIFQALLWIFCFCAANMKVPYSGPPCLHFLTSVDNHWTTCCLREVAATLHFIRHTDAVSSGSFPSSPSVWHHKFSGKEPFRTSDRCFLGAGRSNTLPLNLWRHILGLDEKEPLDAVAKGCCVFIP